MELKNSVTYKSTIGKRISDIRKNLGLNMEDFGKKMVPKASKGAVSNWENGYNLPNNQRLKTIAQLGNISVRELLETNISSSNNEYLGLVLKTLRKSKNMNQKSLSDLSGFSLKKISEHENGLSLLSEADIAIYSSVFDISKNELISKIDEYNDDNPEYTPSSIVFGNLVKEKRLQNNLSLDELSETLEVPKNKILKIEKGFFGDISINILHKIAEYCDISPRHIFELLDTFESYNEYKERAEMQNQIDDILRRLNYNDTKNIYEFIVKNNKQV